MERGITWRAEDTESELAYRYRTEQAAELCRRWHALWLLRQGHTRQAVTRILGINPRTLYDWIAWYQDGGCPAIARHRQGWHIGHHCRLTDDQLAELAAWAADGQFYTYEEAQQWIAETWQVRYTYDGVRSLLNRLGIYPRVPRPLAANTDLTEQDAWKKGGCERRCVLNTRLAPRGWAGVTSSGSV
jgi:transposase